MNEKFYELPEEKQLSVLNAAMEVFSEYEYKNLLRKVKEKSEQVGKNMIIVYGYSKADHRQTAGLIRMNSLSGVHFAYASVINA